MSQMRSGLKTRRRMTMWSDPEAKALDLFVLVSGYVC